MITMRCPHCGHEWLPRVKHPKTCPLCNYRLPHTLKAMREGIAAAKVVAAASAPDTRV